MAQLSQFYLSSAYPGTGNTKKPIYQQRTGYKSAPINEEKGISPWDYLANLYGHLFCQTLRDPSFCHTLMHYQVWQGRRWSTRALPARYIENPKKHRHTTKLLQANHDNRPAQVDVEKDIHLLIKAEGQTSGLKANIKHHIVSTGSKAVVFQSHTNTNKNWSNQKHQSIQQRVRQLRSHG